MIFRFSLSLITLLAILFRLSPATPLPPDLYDAFMIFRVRAMFFMPSDDALIFRRLMPRWSLFLLPFQTFRFDAIIS